VPGSGEDRRRLLRRPLMRVVVASVALSGVLLAGGCAPRVRLALPSGDGTPVADVQDVAQQARSSCRAPAALTADLRLSGRIDGDRVRGTLQVGVASDAMRLEGLAPFGAPVFVLAAQPSGAVLLLPREDAVARAASASELLDAIVGVALAPADLLAIVSGCGLADWKATGAASFGETWQRLDVGDGRRLWLRRGGAPAAGPVVMAAEDERWRVEYTREGSAWPSAIRLQRLGSEERRVTDVVFAVDAPEAVDALPPAALAVDVPAGARVVSVADLRKSRELRER